MKKIHKYIDRQVREAFDELVNTASCSHLLGEIAKHPLSRQEETIEGFYRTILRAKLKGKVNILLAQRRETYGYEHDIVGKRESRAFVVVEIKTPFTDPGGIRFKTQRPEGLPKDIESIKKALDHEVCCAYELVVMFESYAVNKKGKTIQASKAELFSKYGIRWPTEWGYRPTEGEQEVNDAIKSLAKSNGLKVKRKGWRRVELPRPHPKVRAFIDCALYKVQLK